MYLYRINQSLSPYSNICALERAPNFTACCGIGGSLALKIRPISGPATLSKFAVFIWVIENLLVER
jgi:hypothetical protein